MEPIVPKKSELSVGARQLDALHRILNDDFSHTKLTTPTSVREFVTTSDSFKLTTQMTKKTVDVFDLFKDNVDCNIKISKSGLDMFALFYDKTVYITIRLGKTVFSEVECPTNVMYCVNLNVFAKKISTLNRFKPRRLVFGNEGTDLMVTGYPDAQAPGKIVINSLASLVEELNTDMFQYDVVVRTSSEDLARVVDAMPSVFNLSVDTDEKALVFNGSDDLSSIFLALRLSDEVVDTIKQNPDMQNYKASFLKTNLTPLIRASKLSLFVFLGLSKKCPLFATYTITESCDLNPNHDSRVHMYFSPKTDETDN